MYKYVNGQYIEMTAAERTKIEADARAIMPDRYGLVYNNPAYDNADALEKLFNAEKDITLGAGILYTKRAITIAQSGVSISGATPTRTSITMMGKDGDCVVLGTDAGDVVNVRLQDLKLSTWATSPVDASALACYAGYVVFVNRCVLCESKWGFRIRKHGYCLRFQNTQIRWNTVGGVYYSHDAVGQKNDIMFLNCMNMSNGYIDVTKGITAVRTDDIQVGNGYNIAGVSTKIIGGTVENCGGAGVHINAGSSHALVVVGVHFEAGRRACIEFEKIHNNWLIAGNYFMYDAGRIANVYNINNVAIDESNIIKGL